MLYLIFGENDFFCQKKAKEILEKEKAKVDVFDFEEGISFESVKENLKNVDLFEKNQSFLIKNFSKDAQFLKNFEKEAKTLLKFKNFNLIFLEKNPKKIKKEIVSFFEKHGKVFYFPKPKFFEIKKWVKEQFLKSKIEIEERAIQTLIKECNQDLWQINSEIEKLRLFKQKGKITEDDVKKLLFPNLEVNIFEFLDSLFSKDKKKSLVLLEKILEKEEPIKVFALILYYLRHLVLLKESSKTFSKISPFLLQKLKFLAKKFDLQTLKNIYSKMAEGDVLIKSGKVQPQYFLENLIIFEF